MWDTIKELRVHCNNDSCLSLSLPAYSIKQTSLQESISRLPLPRISRSQYMAITARSENRSSDIVDLEQVLIHFICENDHPASVHQISRVQAMTRRRWMFGKASSSQAPSASKRFGSSLSVDCQSVFHLRISFPRDLGNRCLSPRTTCLLLHHPAAVPYLP